MRTGWSLVHFHPKWPFEPQCTWGKIQGVRQSFLKIVSQSTLFQGLKEAGWNQHPRASVQYQRHRHTSDRQTLHIQPTNSWSKATFLKKTKGRCKTPTTRCRIGFWGALSNTNHWQNPQCWVSHWHIQKGKRDQKQQDAAESLKFLTERCPDPKTGDVTLPVQKYNYLFHTELL